MDNFKQSLQKASISLQEIRLIILTHGHWDHVGSTKDIQALTGAKVLLHKNDIGLWNGTPPPEPPGLNLWAKILVVILNLYTTKTHIQNFDVDITLNDEEYSLLDYGIPGKVVYTPGHSSGSVSVLMDDGKAFVGDLATSFIAMRLFPGLTIFGDDLEVIKKSWKKLVNLGAKMVYPAHGKPFPADVIQRAIS